MKKGLERGCKEELKEGRKEEPEEREKNATAIAKTMLSLPLEVIAAATGLSHQELQVLKEEP